MQVKWEGLAAAATPGRVRAALAVLLLAVFVLLQVKPALPPEPDSPLAWQNDGRLHVFVHPECPHCHAAVGFLRTRPEIDFVAHDVSTPANENSYRMVVGRLGIAESELGVPLFVFGDRHFIGFDTPETTGPKLLALARGDLELHGGFVPGVGPHGPTYKPYIGHPSCATLGLVIVENCG